MSKLDRTIATCQGWVKTARRATTPSPGALSLVIFASFLFVACSNGGSDSSNGAAASAPGGDPAPGFELQVFGNESYAKDQPVSLASLEIRATRVIQVLLVFRVRRVLRAPPASRQVLSSWSAQARPSSWTGTS